MYYPKSQIKTNLYTNGDMSSGNNYVLSTDRTLYVGYYYELSTGLKYTGKTPQDGPNILLIEFTTEDSPDKNIPDGVETTSNIVETISTYDSRYVSVKGIDTKKTYNLPVYSPNFPTFQDYQIGEFRRYFCKRINNNIYLETNLNTYNELISKNSNILYQLYIAFNIPWKLTGDEEQVYKTNKNIVELTMKQLKLSQFDKFLKENYIRYYV